MENSDLVTGDLYYLSGAVLGQKDFLKDKENWWFERGYYKDI